MEHNIDFSYDKKWESVNFLPCQKRIINFNDVF